MTKKKKNIEWEMLKAYKRAAREEEIRLHGKPLPVHHVEKSKKVYDRKREKANYRKGDLPYFLLSPIPNSQDKVA